MKPDTFIILSPGFPKDEADSTCLPSLQSFVRHLKKGYPSLQVIVMTLQYPFAAGEYAWHQSRVISMGGKGRAKLFRLLLWQRTWKKLKELQKENNITGILSCWCGEAALIGHRFGRKYSIQHRCWVLGQDARKENRYVQRIKPAASELIALSDFVQREFEKNHGIKPQHVIPLGIDPNEFPHEDAERDIDILGAGSLIPLKQYDVFIEVIRELVLHWPNTRAVLCGKGPEEAALKKLIATYGLEDKITLTGELQHPEILRLMKRSKVFLHTSSYEGFGVVCIEALFAGATVISFCKPMDREIPGWHVVSTESGMALLSGTILNNRPVKREPGIPFEITDTVKKVMSLFGQ